ncbi:MAG: hypothetical protein Q9180_000255 [Flavoplaca navasiana]
MSTNRFSTRRSSEEHSQEDLGEGSAEGYEEGRRKLMKAIVEDTMRDRKRTQAHRPSSVEVLMTSLNIKLSSKTLCGSYFSEEAKHNITRKDTLNPDPTSDLQVEDRHDAAKMTHQVGKGGADDFLDEARQEQNLNSHSSTSAGNSKRNLPSSRSQPALVALRALMQPLMDCTFVDISYQ